MKITLGEWKTRDGRKAIVAADNPDALKSQRLAGWVEGRVHAWCIDGAWSFEEGTKSNIDLISPWTEPVPWDWSTTPPWMFWLFKKESGGWLLSDIEPVLTEHGHGWKTFGYVSPVPSDYSPKWSGDWKLSKTQRPKEVAK